MNMKSRHSWMVVTFLLGIFATACSGGAGSLPQTVGSRSAQSVTVSSGATRFVSSLGNAVAGSYVAIDAGGNGSGAYSADADFSGGVISATTKSAIDTSHVLNPAPQAVYQTQRYGTVVTYTIPNLTPNGAYTVRLHFVESYFTAAGRRIFDAKINGGQVLTGFDIFKSAGGSNIAIVKEFTAKADATGNISIQLSATVNNAIIAAIELSSSTVPPQPLMPGIAISAGGGGSGSWIADTDFTGGWTAAVTNVIDTSHVSDPAPQPVYQSQRVGSTFTYLIPNLTPNGSYTLRLHFAESFFTSAGQRLFNVNVNGTQAINNLDIYATAGGSNVAVVKSVAVVADTNGRLRIAFNAVRNNASIAGVEVLGSTSAPSPSPGPTVGPIPSPIPTSGTSSGRLCAPAVTDPVFSGCFTGNTPYHHTVASLIAAGATVHNDSTAENYWNNGNPLTPNNMNVDGSRTTTMWAASSSNPVYSVDCAAYGTCDAATSVTGLRVHIPNGAHPTGDSDHHFFMFDLGSGQELDMWGGYSDRPGNECEVGTYSAGVLTCSWGGAFPFNGNGLASVPGDSGIAGGAAYGLLAITAGDILGGHITHALGMIGPCLDSGGQWPAQRGRTTDSACLNNSASGGNGAEPTLRYGDLLHLKSSVDLTAPPYSAYTQYCKIVIRALQEYGAYADDNSSGYGLHIIALDQSSPGWQTILRSMISGGDASGSSTSASWNSCLNRIQARDLENVTLNQGGNSALPPVSAP